MSTAKNNNPRWYIILFAGLAIFYIGFGPLVPESNKTLKYSIMIAGLLLVVAAPIYNARVNKKNGGAE